MSAAFLKRLGLVLAALVLIWLVSAVFRRASSDRPVTFRLPKVDRNAIDTIRIERPTESIRLAKHGAGWTVNGFAAAADLVGQLLDAVTDTTSPGELIAENASSHERLGIDSAQARRLVMRAGGKAQLDVLVGKRGPNFETVYVRLPGEKAVYQIAGRLAEPADRKVDDWRDKRIVEIVADSIGGIEVTRTPKSYALSRDAKGWTIGGNPADSGAVAGLLRQFQKLEATGFATPNQADSADFRKPDRVVRVLDRRKVPLVSLAFDSTTGGYWVRRDSMSTVFRIDSWAANQLAPADSTLRKKP